VVVDLLFAAILIPCGVAVLALFVIAWRDSRR